MHAFSPDASILFLLDAFGLSRIALDGRGAKTNTSVSGGGLVGAGSRLTLAPFGHGTATVLDAKTLARPPGVRDSYGDVIAHPDGKRVLSFGHRGLEIAGKAVATKPKKLGARALGRPLPLPPRVAGRAHGLVSCDDGGVVAHYDPLEAVLTRFRLAGATPTEVVSVEVPVPIGELSLVVAAGAVMLATREPSTGRAHALFLDAAAALRVESFDTIAPLAFDGATVASQPDEQTVALVRGGRTERVAIPKAARGLGEPMVRGERVLFVPPSRETVVDLRSGASIDRKLPAGERAARKKLLTFLAGAAAIGDPFDVTFAAQVVTYPGVKDRSFQLDVSLGDQSLFSLLARGAVERTFIDRFGANSTSAAVEVTRTTEAALEAGLAKLAAAGVSLRDAVIACARPFEQTVGRVGAPVGAGGRLFARKAGERFLEAVLGGAPTAERLEAFDEGARMRFPGNAREALAWALIDIQGAEAWPTLFAWIVTRPDQYAAANVGNASDVLVRICEVHPEVRFRLLDACDRARTGSAAQKKRVAELARTLGAFERGPWRESFTSILAGTLKEMLPSVKKPVAIALNCTPWQKGDVVSLSIATAADDPRAVEAWEIASWKHFEISRKSKQRWPYAVKLGVSAHGEYLRCVARNDRSHLAFRDQFCEDCAKALRDASPPARCRLYVGHPDAPGRNYVR